MALILYQTGYFVQQGLYNRLGDIGNFEQMLENEEPLPDMSENGSAGLFSAGKCAQLSRKTERE
jgi:hypothetical protein